MLTNITYRVLDDYFIQSTNSVYEYIEPSTYCVYICKSEVNNKTVYDLEVSYKNHTVWACGGYSSTASVVKDLLTKANKVFEESHNMGLL